MATDPVAMRYEHTQTGYQMLAVSLVLAAVISLRAGSSLVFGLMGLVMLVAGSFFGTLTTAIDDTSVTCRFGPLGGIHERFQVADIASARAVRNSPLHGWGMRYIRHGRLWNVWGLDAVELQLRNGTRFRIGTDEPQELVKALQRAGVHA
jgi:hypothetical protein